MIHSVELYIVDIKILHLKNTVAVYGVIDGLELVWFSAVFRYTF